MLSLEEKMERVKDLRPIDDVFFEVLARNKDVCQEILRTILEDPELMVEDVIVQSSERNLYGRSVRLDALCFLGGGAKCNIEVQRSDNDDHLRRARFNASSITVKNSNTKDDFSDVDEVYIVYISEFDFIRFGKTIYHMKKSWMEIGEAVDDGLHEIFVNTVVDDHSKIAELMSCFVRKDVANDKFPALSGEVKRLKTTEGGMTAMCGVMEKYLAEARTEGEVRGIEKGIEKGIEQGRENAIHDIVLRLLEAGKTTEEIADLTGVDPELVKRVEASRKG